MNGTVLLQLRKGRRLNILSARTDKKGRLWYEVKPENSSKTGFVLASLINLDKGYVISDPTDASASALAFAGCISQIELMAHFCHSSVVSFDFSFISLGTGLRFPFFEKTVIHSYGYVEKILGG